MNKQTYADVLGVAEKKGTKPLIHHTWKTPEGTTKLKHKKCITCGAEQFYSPEIGRVVYMDIYGRLYFKVSPCYFPNAKK